MLKTRKDRTWQEIESESIELRLESDPVLLTKVFELVRADIEVEPLDYQLALQLFKASVRASDGGMVTNGMASRYREVAKQLMGESS
jgi:hypothetical protein